MTKKRIRLSPTTQKMFRTLGLLKQREELIKRLKAGLPIAVFYQLSEAYEIPSTRLAPLMGIPLRTLARRKKEGRLNLSESERMFRAGYLFQKALTVLGDKEAVLNWFKNPKKALAGKPPLEYLDTEIGAREVEDMLGRLEHGVFA
jgi:putative toxin-antitoxin system antitoxin component (TIGR02293 family)